MKVHFGDRPVGVFRADLVVARTVLVELKALPSIERDHVAQTLNALRATGLEVGLILNFGPKAQIKRIIFTRKPKRPYGRSRRALICANPSQICVICGYGPG